MATPFDTFRQLLRDNRSYRRFDASRPVGRGQLEELVGLTRLCASGRNLQPLRYRIVCDAGETDRVFPLLKWAGYLTDWAGPSASERPTAYLVQCLDLSLTKNCLCDDGIQLQAIRMGAISQGIGSCIIKAFNREALAGALGIDLGRYEPLYVLALGYPSETAVIDDLEPSATDIRYTRTPDDIHHVPKRPLSDLLIP